MRGLRPWAIFTLCVAMILVATAGCRSSALSTPTVTVGDVDFEVEVAKTQAEQTQGLSDRESLPPMTGMLFLFGTVGPTAMWMRGMEFPLGFVWIGEECTVVDTALNAPPPAPGTPDSQLTRYASAAPAAYTLEVNAGQVEQRGIQVDDNVRFSGISADGADC